MNHDSRSALEDRFDRGPALRASKLETRNLTLVQRANRQTG